MSIGVYRRCPSERVQLTGCRRKVVYRDSTIVLPPLLSWPCCTLHKSIPSCCPPAPPARPRSPRGTSWRTSHNQCKIWGFREFSAKDLALLSREQNDRVFTMSFFFLGIFSGSWIGATDLSVWSEFTCAANQHPKSTKSPQTFAYLVHFSEKVSAMFDNLQPCYFIDEINADHAARTYERFVHSIDLMQIWNFIN